MGQNFLYSNQSVQSFKYQKGKFPPHGADGCRTFVTRIFVTRTVVTRTVVTWTFVTWTFVTILRMDVCDQELTFLK